MPLDDSRGHWRSAVNMTTITGTTLDLTNSLVADNMKVFTWEDVSCNVTYHRKTRNKPHTTEKSSVIGTTSRHAAR